MTSDVTKLFTDSGLRLTTPRKLLFETLKRASSPLSQTELAMENPTIDKASVYRTIELFMRLGIVIGVPHGWKQRYELAAPFRPHHHHLFCTECGKIEEIQSEKLEKIIHLLADEEGFVVTGHTFEVTGMCYKCQQVKRVS